MLEELGISLGTAVFILFALYFVIKWAVRSAIDDSKGEIAKAVKKGIKQYEAEKSAAPDPDEDDEEDP